LLAPLALAGRGAFRTLDLTPHARTNMDVIGTFLDVEFVVRELEGGHLVEIEAAK
jgi:RNA 3'-terminal phosphate cyclase